MPISERDLGRQQLLDRSIELGFSSGATLKVGTTLGSERRPLFCAKLFFSLCHSTVPLKIRRPTKTKTLVPIKILGGTHKTFIFMWWDASF